MKGGTLKDCIVASSEIFCCKIRLIGQPLQVFVGLYVWFY